MSKEAADLVAAVSLTESEPSASPGTVAVVSETTPIALRIRDALLDDARLAGADLHVRVKGEHATLSGSVQTEDQRNLALRIAGRYVGRDRVSDDIQTGEQTSLDVCEA